MPATVRVNELSTVIIGHPSRLDRAERLAKAHPGLDARVVVDPEPDGPPSALRAVAAAWSAVPAEATHHLVLRDDAVLCDDFPDQLAAGLRAFPCHALALFCEWGSDTSFLVRHAVLGGFTWVLAIDRYVSTVATVLPAGAARRFGERLAIFKDGLAGQDDAALRSFVDEEGVPAICPVPNLVDHEPLRSACFRDDAGPAGDDPEPALLTPGTVPYYSCYTGLALSSNPDDRQPYGYRIDPIGAELTRRGLAVTAVAASACAAVAAWRDRHLGLPIKPLEELWTWAYTLGVVMAADPLRSTTPAGAPRPDRQPPVDRAAFEKLLAEPAAARALATMPQGALHILADPGVLAVSEEPLADLIREAILTGFDAARRR